MYFLSLQTPDEAKTARAAAGPEALVLLPGDGSPQKLFLHYPQPEHQTSIGEAGC